MSDRNFAGQQASGQFVDLLCVKEGSKLRVRITSAGYLPHANCQFPRNIRVEGRRYRVPDRDVRLVAVGRRNFYRVNGREVQILEGEAAASVPKVEKIYEDESETNCAICLDAPKDTVFAGCGHFYTCAKCAAALNTCPICRGVITARINKSQIE